MLTPRGTCRLDLLIGIELWAFIPIIEPNGPIWVTVNNAEDGGVWLESDRFTLSWCMRRPVDDEIADEFKSVVFVPYQQIVYMARFDTLSTDRRNVLRFGQRGEQPGPKPA